MAFEWKEIADDVAGQLGAGADELQRIGKRVTEHARGIAERRFSPDANVARGRIELAAPGDVEALDEIPGAEREELARLGQAAIESGKVAVAVLNGGMATRFGGVVKGIVEVAGGRSFLEIKRDQARRLGPVPFLIMNSFATHAASLEFLRRKGLEGDVLPFEQEVSVRLTPQGEPLLDATGRVSLYAPGHGDFAESLDNSGLLRELARRGVEAIVLSNVDNLGAELDPVLVGLHLKRARPLTTEVARTLPGDVGGAPAFVDGKLQIVEGFRFPRGFDFTRVPFLATNTFVISRALLERQHELSWFYVEKNVDGKTAVQMERLVNELSRFAPTTYVATPRGGPRGRFFPIKVREDLERLRADPELVRRFAGIE
jgi:UTP--glucose-1-phosphate uridylyltransferase